MSARKRSSAPTGAPGQASLDAMSSTHSAAWSLDPTVDTALKFNSDGTVRTYRGNTVICDVAAGSALGLRAGGVRSLIERSASSRQWAFLPPSSYHMTVIQLLSEPNREPAVWSSRLDLGCSLEQNRRVHSRGDGPIWSRPRPQR